MCQRLLKAAEAAEFLGVKKTTIYALTKARDLPAIIVGQRHFRYDPVDLERYVESRKLPELSQAVSDKNREAGLLGQRELQKRKTQAPLI
jgi:excisionase family DNA binding protein